MSALETTGIIHRVVQPTFQETVVSSFLKQPSVNSLPLQTNVIRFGSRMFLPIGASLSIMPTPHHPEFQSYQIRLLAQNRLP
jgi:hypothetical protein